MATKKFYLVIGSNNFWYAQERTKRDAIAHAKEVVKGAAGYGDDESGHTPDTPETVYVYGPCEEVDRFYREDEDEEEEQDTRRACVRSVLWRQDRGD